jgi:hypothetical protein
MRSEMITDQKIERYIHDLLPARDPVLTEIEEYAEDQKIPIVGPAVGRFLAALVVMTKARRIFELGSAIGYSTIWLARAAGESAELHYFDGSAQLAERARAYFERAAVADPTLCVSLTSGFSLLRISTRRCCRCAMASRWRSGYRTALPERNRDRTRTEFSLICEPSAQPRFRSWVGCRLLHRIAPKAMDRDFHPSC